MADSSKQGVVDGVTAVEAVDGDPADVGISAKQTVWMSS